MKVYIDTLEGQLRDEAQNSKLLKEELEASRRLCCQLHEACSRGDVAKPELDLPPKATKPVSVEHRFVQTLPTTEKQSEFTVNSHSKTQHMEDVQVHSIAGRLQRAARIAEDYQSKVKMLENEIMDLKKECRERDFQVRTIAQQLSGYIHWSTKLEAQQVSLRDNLRRATNMVKSKEDELICSQKLLEKTNNDLKEQRESKTSLARKCTELQELVANYETEVTALQEELCYSNQKCRTLGRKIQVLKESLESEQGEVARKETALETKNTILEAIKTIAYTSPSPKMGSHSITSRKQDSFSLDISTKKWLNAHAAEDSPYSGVSEQLNNANDTNLSQQKIANKEKHAQGEHKPHSWKTSTQSYGSDHCSHGNDYLYTNGCESSDQEISLKSQQSDAQTSDTDSESNGSYQHLSALSSNKSCEVHCKRRTSPDMHQDADDEEELNLEDPCEADVLIGRDECDVKYGVEAEGLLLRKQEQENYAMRSRDRSWHHVYIVQHGTLLWFYETRDHKIQGKTLLDEPPVDLMDACVTIAMDYTRRKHVFRVQLATGKQYLFQARDDREMMYWVCCMDSAARCQTALSSEVLPSIGTVGMPQMGSPSKSDRIKRVIKGSLSALKK